MTEAEAIEILQEERDWCQEPQYVKRALTIAEEALKKQIPKKPFRLDYKLLIDAGWTYGCPNCKCACGQNKYTDYEYIEAQEPFCGQCGQAIDWK